MEFGCQETQRNKRKFFLKKHDLIPNSRFCPSLPSESIQIRAMAYDGEKVGVRGAHQLSNYGLWLIVLPHLSCACAQSYFSINREGCDIPSPLPSVWERVPHDDCRPEWVSSIRRKRLLWIRFGPGPRSCLVHGKFSVNVGNGGTKQSQPVPTSSMWIKWTLSWRQLCDWLEDRQVLLSPVPLEYMLRIPLSRSTVT